MFDLRTVEYFLVAVEHGSLRAAAQALGITQPALTKAIRRLENSFDTQLFERRSHGVRLTAAGEAVARRAREASAVLGTAIKEVDALRSGNAGLLAVGAGSKWLERVLPSAIVSFQAERPGVLVHVRGGSDSDLKEALRAGAIDLVLAAVPDGPLLEPDLACRSLLTDEYCIVADRNHPLRSRGNIQAADLLDFPWILPFPASHMVARLHHFMLAAGLPPPEPRIVTDLVPVKLSLLRGTTYLSCHTVNHLKALGETQVIPLNVEGMRGAQQAGLLQRRGIAPTPAAAAFVDVLERHCAAYADAGADVDSVAHARRTSGGPMTSPADARLPQAATAPVGKSQ